MVYGALLPAGRGGSIEAMTQSPNCSPANLAGRLWFPGPASIYSPAQREAIASLFRSHVERACLAARPPCARRRPKR
jgi:hypothetical protein